MGLHVIFLVFKTCQGTIRTEIAKKQQPLALRELLFPTEPVFWQSSSKVLQRGRPICSACLSSHSNRTSQVK
ncbi:hypothetical protein DM01DRAFT_152621 [Hesseltinella vesiculosa]|uniref:Uncharacterized protein n=1 Tax=Hesseltinella vesiculosa TaxID=101127 RepID=A0A1X2GYH4_9FUNG|nr:hypothetical protein DM01DRAFT_152621 [Hesseltinella vesiculosa]